MSADNEQKHTPTPWRVIQGTIIKQDCRPIGLGDDSGVQIGSASGYPNSGFFPSDAEAVANAAFIVRAVNSHEQLVSALGEAIRDLECSGYAWDHPFLVKLRATLTAAGAA